MLDKLIEKVEAKIVEVVETMMNKGVYDGSDAANCHQLLAVRKTLKEATEPTITINPPFVPWVHPHVPWPHIPIGNTVIDPFPFATNDAFGTISNMIFEAESRRLAETDRP